MNKRKATNGRQQAREKILFRYSSALERGDFETVESLLTEAAQDPALDKMMAEINAVYEAELNVAHTILSAQSRQREDLTMVSSVIGATPLPKAPSFGYRPSGLLALVAVLVVALAGAAFIITQGGPNRMGNTAALLQSESATPTMPPTFIPSPSPLPATIELMEGAPQPVSGCDTPNAVLSSPVNGQVLTEPVTITGMANAENFAYYRLELMGPTSTDFLTIFGEGRTPVTEMGALQMLHPGMFEPGEYQLRLSVFDVTNTLQANCTIHIMLASTAPMPVTEDTGPVAVCDQAVTLRDVDVRVRPSISSTVVGLIPSATGFTVLAGALPAPDDTSVKPNWVFVKADVAGNSVQGWMSMNDAERVPCPTLVPGGEPVTALATFTPVPFSGTIAEPQAVPTLVPPAFAVEGTLCQALIVVPDGVDVYSRPATDAVLLNHIPSDITLNILDTTYGPFRGEADPQIVWNYVAVVVNGAPVQGWVSAEFTRPMGSNCPLPAVVQTQIAPPVPAQSLAPLEYTATAIVAQASETVAAAQPAVVMAVPTVETLDPLSMTATSFVQALTATAAVELGYITIVPPDIAMTATALSEAAMSTLTVEAGVLALPTGDPLEPLLLTATGIVQEATGTAFAVSGASTFTPTPASAGVVAATPASVFLTHANEPNVQVVTTVALGALPANAPVQIVSAQYTESGWVYQIQSAEEIQAVAVDSQLSFYIQSSNGQSCDAVNTGTTAVVVRSAPEVIAPVVGKLTNETQPTVKVIAVQAGSDRNWFLLDGGTFMGWVPYDTVMLVGEGCGPMINPTTAVAAVTGGDTLTPTPYVFSAEATADPVLCKVVNGSTNEVTVRSLPSTASDSLAMGILPNRIIADVQEITSDPANGAVWYYVNVEFRRARLQGWVQADSVTTISRCPPLGG